MPARTVRPVRLDTPRPARSHHPFPSLRRTDSVTSRAALTLSARTRHCLTPLIRTGT
ncbi:hypothetical protein BGLA2_470003 [Burkholderia gladioli]|nr:hypothetical protein BGLA2_470003 [Burkholderia gladioli]